MHSRYVPKTTPRLSSLAETNEAVTGRIIFGVFNNFGREVALLDGDYSLECIAGRLMVRTPDQTQRMVDTRTRLLSEQASELATFSIRNGEAISTPVIEPEANPFVKEVAAVDISSFIGEVSDATEAERASYRDQRPSIRRPIVIDHEMEEGIE